MNPEPRLLKACIQGDRRAQFELYKLCYPTLMGVCRRYRKNEDEVAAMLNTGFLRMLNNLKKYSPSVPFIAWTKRIMINILIDDFRKNKKEREQVIYAEADRLMTDGNTVDYNEAEKYFDANHIECIINELPEISCQVFNLFAIDGYSHKEIADQLGMSEGTSKWYLSGARKMIQEQLSKEMKKSKAV
ncbi:MAG: sigma-70 family RNA polymerase sigma factor [Saprospiraceae bacterium]|nr:sigma-70 family RNA polymerase sigma factor [Saprospiraceae bacterium]MCB9324766.1 sigma-70 family RNA polymerase sigma factor [Lewinellaceae bacterium]